MAEVPQSLSSGSKSSCLPAVCRDRTAAHLKFTPPSSTEAPYASFPCDGGEAGCNETGRLFWSWKWRLRPCLWLGRDPGVWEPLSSFPPGIAEGLSSCQGLPAKNCRAIRWPACVYVLNSRAADLHLGNPMVALRLARDAVKFCSSKAFLCWD